MIVLEKPSRQTGRVYVRGVFTREEAITLSTYDSISEQTWLVYKTPLSIGLKIGELRNLRPDNLKVIRDQHCIHLKPKQVKNRSDSVSPIPGDLFELLAGGLDIRGFDKSARALRKNRQTAGLPLEDVDGRLISFDSLRAVLGDPLIQ